MSIWRDFHLKDKSTGVTADVLAGGEQTVVNYGNDYNSDISGIDASTETQICITYEHHEIHGGSHFFIEDVVDLSLNNVFDVQWTTSDSTKWPHFRFTMNCEARTEWYIYQGVTIKTPGTPMVPINNNRNSDKTTNSTIAMISNTSLSNANDDTVVSDAIVIAHGIVGARKVGGLITRGDEIVFRQNTIYGLRAIANTAGYTNFLMSWYEHRDKN